MFSYYFYDDTTAQVVPLYTYELSSDHCTLPCIQTLMNVLSAVVAAPRYVITLLVAMCACAILAINCHLIMRPA